MTSSAGGKTILLVEDEALIAMAEKFSLKRAGDSVITADIFIDVTSRVLEAARFSTPADFRACQSAKSE
jgi:hypothetical protein